MALDDVAGPIDAHEVERHAARARPLQRRQAMADLLEARPEHVAQPLDVVAHRTRGGEKAAVGHEQRAGEIIGERDARDRRRRGAAEGGGADDGVDLRRLFDEADLMGDLKGAGLGVQAVAKGQYPADAVEPPHEAGGGFDALVLDAHGMFGEQVIGQRIGGHPRADRLSQFLGRLVERREIIAPIVEKVAHLLVGKHGGGIRAAPRLAGADGLVEDLQPFVGAPEGEMELQEGMREPGRIAGDGFQVLNVRHQPREDGVGQRLAQVAHQALGVILREMAEIDGKGLSEANEDGRREGALVVLDLVQIARR